MEYFHSISDSDIFENPFPEPETYIDRPTVKGLVLDNEEKIALLCSGHHGLLPGGGIDEGETPEEAFIRECKEEIGCDIEILSKIGTAAQFRSKVGRKYEIHFFLAVVIGEKGIPTTTQEDELRCETQWLNPYDMRSVLQKQIAALPIDGYYQTHFNSRSHLAALEKYLEMKK